MASIFLQGNMSDGFTAVGPFEDMDDAFEYADGREGWLMECQPPDNDKGKDMP